MKDLLKIVTIADPHCAAMNAIDWAFQMNEGVIDEIEKIEEFDVLFIAGDYFHKKISANSDHMKAAMQVIFRLITICAERDAKLRIIKGTESHDNKQLDVFEELVGRVSCDFRVFQTLAEEQLFPNFKVLYIPEEYKVGKEYYEPYLSEEDKYDMIVGHGMTDIATFVAKVQESEETHPAAPIFEVEELLKASTGPVHFGHIHKWMHKDRFRYVGALMTWAFGENQDKGFMYTEYNTIDRKIKDEKFILNKYVRTYITWKYDIDDKIFQLPPEEIVTAMLRKTKNYSAGYLRLHLRIPDGYSDPAFLTNLMNETFAHHELVRLKIDNMSAENVKKRVQEEHDEIMARYQMLFNKAIPPEEKLKEFIEIQYGRNIPLEKIIDYLNNPFKGVR